MRPCSLHVDECENAGNFRKRLNVCGRSGKREGGTSARRMWRKLLYIKTTPAWSRSCPSPCRSLLHISPRKVTVSKVLSLNCHKSSKNEKNKALPFICMINYRKNYCQLFDCNNNLVANKQTVHLATQP